MHKAGKVRKGADAPRLGSTDSEWTSLHVSDGGGAGVAFPGKRAKDRMILSGRNSFPATMQSITSPSPRP